MFDYKNDVKLYPFEISADNGNTWTRQLMTYLEAVNEFKIGHIVKFKVMQECEDCGALFYIEYSTDGSYEYMNDACVTMEAKAIWNQSKEYARLSSKIETLNEVLMDIIDIRCEKIFEDTN